MDIDRFQYFIRKISVKTGIDLKQYRDNYLRRRIELRMKILGIDDYLNYLKILNRDKEELEKLISTLTINVTEFMRDKTPFEFFMKFILPEIAEKKRRAKSNLLRFWSAGCAGGEEVYSILICVLETLGNGWSMSIYGTDIDENCLKSANNGVYKPEQLKNLSSKIINKYFVKEGNLYKIKKPLKKYVRFKRHDLTSEGPVSKYFDAIFCRNVMIYFNEKQKRKVVKDFHNALVDEGYLIIGKSETLPVKSKNMFLPVDLREKIYKKSLTSHFNYNLHKSKLKTLK